MSTLQSATLPFILLLLLLVPIESKLNNVDGAKQHKQRREVITSSGGAVAADDGRCSRIGRDVLVEGGNAVDAAVATAFCLGVVSPASSGIGGGAFMVVRMANGTTQALDMRETAPLKASQDMFAGNPTLKASGALAVAVLGEVAGLYDAWKMHGKLPWKRLVHPAEQLARGGFRISPYLSFQMSQSNSSIFEDEGLRRLFTSKGKLLQQGNVVRNEKLASTLRAISKHGSQALYDGAIGEALVKDIKKLGGIISMEDLRSYQVKVRDPIVTDFDALGLKIIGMPPPSSGGPSMILILNILAQYGFPKGVSGSIGVHRLIESLKHAFAVRMNLGDPEFTNVTAVVSDILSPKFAQVLKNTINDHKTFPPKYYGDRWNIIEDHGTSHISIVDGERNAVSITSTINAYFGAKILSPSTGIILNNEMDDFSIPLVNATSSDTPPSSPANFIRPGKRPLSSMSPTIILKDGNLKGVVGASGGSMIIGATTEVFLNYFAKGMDPFSSVFGPRIYHPLIPNRVRYENWTIVTGDHIEVPTYIRTSLQSKGHILEALTMGGAITQFIVLENMSVQKGQLVAVSDPRKGGFPAGY